MLREELSARSAELCKAFFDTISIAGGGEHSIARAREDVLRRYNEARLSARSKVRTAL